jgi:hypothetical protein
MKTKPDDYNPRIPAKNKNEKATGIRQATNKDRKADWRRGN